MINSIIKDYKDKLFINRIEKNIPIHKKVRILYHNSSFLEREYEDFLLKKVEKGHKVQPLVDFLDKKNDYTDLALVNGSYFLRTKQFSVLNKKRNFLLKRLIDIILSLILLVLLSPIILVTVVLIRLDSKGLVFYSQKRIGLFNKEFKLFKFRSMFIDAEENGAVWAKKNDKRITRIGKFIRKIRVDELPQLINVLKGEMSLIGPRPEREIFTQELKKHIPYYEFRHAVKPGITGWAQVKYPYGASIEDAQWKHKYDLYYIKYQNLMLDLKIIFLTIKIILFGKGR
ncbi:MAG: exopolysaccharide biosynthesis polyprenyl glycosylphosphotransferase [Flavobacteriales bacterium AspAUS03]